MQVDKKKIRNAFHEFSSGVAPDNTKDRAFAYWALCDLPNGGPFYLLGNTKIVELWSSANQTSKRSKSQLVVRVKNDAAGYAQIEQALEKQVALDNEHPIRDVVSSEYLGDDHSLDFNSFS